MAASCFPPTTQTLRVDGKLLTQSHAILRYAGTLAGLTPTDPFHAAKVDELLAHTEDLLGPEFYGALHNTSEVRPHGMDPEALPARWWRAHLSMAGPCRTKRRARYASGW